MKHIVFSGQIANGKDVVADSVEELLNARRPSLEDKWHRIAFAGAVKDIYCQTFGVDRAFVEQYKRNPEPPPGFLQTVRKSLQFIGDGFRKIQGDVWINLALRDPRRVIISDGRYVNEARATHKLGGTNVVVWRPGFENDEPNESESQILTIVQWCLETEQDGPIKFTADQNPPPGIAEGCYDYFFRNDVPTMEQLREKVERELIPFLLDRY